MEQEISSVRTKFRYDSWIASLSGSIELIWTKTNLGFNIILNLWLGELIMYIYKIFYKISIIFFMVAGYFVFNSRFCQYIIVYLFEW
jgi:hypothetical protein